MLLLIVSGSRAHGAKKAVVVLSVSGPQGGQAHRLINKALGAQYKIISAGRFRRAAKKNGVSIRRAGGRSKVARTLRVAAIITGSIGRVGGRWVLRLTVHSGHNGKRVGSAAFPLRGTRLDPATARRIPGGLRRALSQAQTGAARASSTSRNRRRKRKRQKPPAVAAAPVAQPQTGPETFDDGSEIDATEQTYGATPTMPHEVPYQRPQPAPQPMPQPTPQPMPQPTPQPTPSEEIFSEGSDDSIDSGSSTLGDEGDEDLGFEVERRRASRKARIPRYRRSRRETDTRLTRRSERRPFWESILELSVGFMLINRQFDFNDPISPRRPEDHSNYKSGYVAAGQLEGTFYPILYFHRSPLANLGILIRYYRVFVLKSQSPKSQEPAKTTFHTLELGLRYRWNLFDRFSSPVLKFGLEFGRLGFAIWDTPEAPINLPDIAYYYLKLAILGVDLPLYSQRRVQLGLTGSFDWLLIFSAGDIERTDSSGYGRSSTGGVDISLGAFASYKGFFVRANGFYRRIFFDFDNACYQNNLGCRAAGGALDIYTGGTLMVGYAL